MELTYYRNGFRMESTYILRIHDVELVSARLYGFDHALIRDVDNDPESTIADKLLVLEMLARRIEESEQARAQAPSTDGLDG